MSKKSLRVLLVTLAVAGACLALLNTEQRFVAAPALALLTIAFFFLVELWNRDKVFPFFEIGAFTVATTTIYSVLPLVQHLAVGMVWSPLSDNRFIIYQPTPEQFGGFAWRHVLYLLSLATAYLWARGKTKSDQTPLNLPDRATSHAIVILFVLVMITLMILGILYGPDIGSSSDLEEHVRTMENVPLIVKQITSKLEGISLMLQVMVCILVLSHHGLRRRRYLLYAWLGYQFVSLLMEMGSRTGLVFSILIILLLYHRMVRPFKAWVIFGVASLLLMGALLYGVARDVGRFTNIRSLLELELNPFSATNEFFSMYGTAYDVYARKEQGALSDVPWQLYISELTLLIPQQIMPFEKVDPAEWYLDQLGIRGRGVGFMWGVISQSVVGFGFIELIVRGVVLGIFLACLHRWYMRNCKNWVIMSLYVLMCIWSYYTYRALTFYFLVFVQYYFVGSVLMIYFLRFLLKCVHTEHSGTHK